MSRSSTSPGWSYEIDAFHDAHGIVVEVEAGRGARGNATYRDIIRTSLIVDAQYLALLRFDPAPDHHIATLALAR